MGIVIPIALIVCGILAASSYIVSKKPNAKELIDKMVPIQGWLGLVVCVLGIWALISILLHIGALLHFPEYFIVALLVALLEIGLGFLLGYGLINEFALSKNPEAAAKGQVVRAKLMSYQTPMGVAGIVVGVIGLVEALRFHM